MPPASPAPGWSSGLVCTERVATRRGVAERGVAERGGRRTGTCNLPLVCPVMGVETAPCRLFILQQRQDVVHARYRCVPLVRPPRAPGCRPYRRRHGGLERDRGRHGHPP